MSKWTRPQALAAPLAGIYAASCPIWTTTPAGNKATHTMTTLGGRTALVALLCLAMPDTVGFEGLMVFMGLLFAVSAPGHRFHGVHDVGVDRVERGSRRAGGGRRRCAGDCRAAPGPRRGDQPVARADGVVPFGSPGGGTRCAHRQHMATSDSMDTRAGNVAEVAGERTLISDLSPLPCIFLDASPGGGTCRPDAPIAQTVERLHGKEKVNGSIPFGGSVRSRSLGVSLSWRRSTDLRIPWRGSSGG